MNGLKNSTNMPLLHEVRKDAFAKSADVEYGERLFSLIYFMDLMEETARREGLLCLDEAVKEYPTEIGFHSDLQLMVSYIEHGLDADDMIEILTARYWIKNLQGEDALLYFMMILSAIRINDVTSPYLLECLLLACLPDKAADKYTEYKKQRKYEPTPAEELMNSDCYIMGEGKGILVVKRLLEEKIELADARTLKRVIHDAEKVNFVTSLKGLSMSARRKLFSVIPDFEADEYATDYEYMGPVIQKDVIEAMCELIAVFEKFAPDTKRQGEKE